MNPLTKAQIKHIKGLGNKNNCETSKTFVVEGAKSVQDLLLAGIMPIEIYVSTKCENVFPEAVLVPDHVLEQITFLKNHSNVVALFEIPQANTSLKMKGLSIALDGVQDPGNVGTIIRIADWVGIENIYASLDSAFAYLPKVVQATMGSIGRIKIAYTNLEQLFLSNPTIPKFAASLKGKNLYEYTPINEGCIVLGSEGKGITNTVQQLCKNKIFIQGSGKAESLNVAVAGGIITSFLARK